MTVNKKETTKRTDYTENLEQYWYCLLRS